MTLPRELLAMAAALDAGDGPELTDTDALVLIAWQLARIASALEPIRLRDTEAALQAQCGMPGCMQVFPDGRRCAACRICLGLEPTGLDVHTPAHPLPGRSTHETRR